MTCPLCDGTGYKDYAGFAMDPCDHEKGPTIRPALNRSTASGRHAMISVASQGFTMTQQAEQAMALKVGDKVQKVKGYKWPGVVVGVFDTLAGKPRIVVECTVPEVAGALHIYNTEQVELIA